MNRARISIVAAALIACTGGLVVLEQAEPGSASASVDRRLTVTIDAGSGTVTSAPAGIACPPTCSGFFPSGTTVTLTAVPRAGFRFDTWAPLSGCGVQPACVVTLGSFDRTVGVIFRPAATLHVFPNGNGVVAVSPPGIDLDASGEALVTTCDSAVSPEGCRLAYIPGTGIAAAALPGSGRTFASWSDFRCRVATCAIEAVEGESSLVATFDPLELAVAISGAGTVTSSPAGIACGDGGLACRIAARPGARIVLTAGAGPHEWVFGCDPEGGDPGAARCTATVSAAPTWVGVRFGSAEPPGQPSRISVRLDVAKRGPGNGTVRGAKIDCGPTCTARYGFGDLEELEAVDAPGSRFQRWIGGCGTTRACRFPVGPITSLEAVFASPLAARFVSVRATRRGAGREVVARIRVNRAARVSLRLTLRGRRVAGRNVGVRAGQTALRLKVPPRGVRGRYAVVAVVTAGREQRRLVRFVSVGR